MSELGFEAKTNIFLVDDEDTENKTVASDNEETSHEEYLEADSKPYRRTSFDLRGCFLKKLVII